MSSVGGLIVLTLISFGEAYVIEWRHPVWIQSGQRDSSSPRIIRVYPSTYLSWRYLPSTEGCLVQKDGPTLWLSLAHPGYKMTYTTNPNFPQGFIVVLNWVEPQRKQYEYIFLTLYYQPYLYFPQSNDRLSISSNVLGCLFVRVCFWNLVWVALNPTPWPRMWSLIIWMGVVALC